MGSTSDSKAVDLLQEAVTQDMTECLAEVQNDHISLYVSKQ